MTNRPMVVQPPYSAITNLIFGRSTQQFARSALRYAPLWPATYANAPTLALSGPGGASPINSGSPTKIPYLGCALGLSTNGATASGAVLNFASTTNVMPGMAVQHGVASSNIPTGTVVLSTTSTTVTLSNAVTGSGVASGDLVGFGSQVVTFLGMVPTFRTQFSTNYYQNGCNGGWTQPGYAIEAETYTADMAVRFRPGGGSTYIWVWVDGQPVTAAPQSLTSLSGGSIYYYRITFNNASDSTIRLRKIRIYLGGAGSASADFGGIDISPADTISPVKNLYTKIAILGDSWTEGALSATPQQLFAAALGQMYGVVPFICGQGGTGYIANGGGGSKAAYTDATRLSTLALTAADVVYVCGSINDTGQTLAAVQAAAGTVFDTISASLPSAKIFAVGVEPNPTSLSTASYQNQNNGISAAAAARNIQFIDWLNEGWVYGTGHVGGTTGNGNADVFIGSDAVHPQPGAGSDYLGQRLFERTIGLYS